MPGGSVYKDHTFNKETAPTSHETAQYIARIFTVQVHERKYNISTWTLENTAENRKYISKQDEYTARKSVKPIARRYIVWAIPTLYVKPLHSASLSLHITFITLLHLPDFSLPNPLPKCMRFNGGSPYRPVR
jgi:hypothetical protein